MKKKTTALIAVIIVLALGLCCTVGMLLCNVFGKSAKTEKGAESTCCTAYKAAYS